MKQKSNIEAATTAQTTDSPAVVHERLVRLLSCPFCGTEAEITDESQPDRPKSWFFAWCKNRPECNAWLAGESPEKVAEKWNRRTSPIPEIRAAVERIIGTTNIPLSAARVRVTAIEEVLEILDGIESSETNVLAHPRRDKSPNSTIKLIAVGWSVVFA